MFGSSLSGQGPTSTSIFGGTDNATQQQPSGLGLFGASTQQQQQQPSGLGLFGGSTQQQPSGSAQQPQAKSIGTATPVPSPTPVFGQSSSGLSGFDWGKGTTGFGTSPLKPLTPSATSAKKFLPGRPSLQDILSVAPQWREGFEKVNKEIVERDEHLSQLKSLLRELKTKNETQKGLLEEKQKVVKAHQTAQHWIESEIDNALPVISKLQRQCTTLSESCERTVTGGTSETRFSTSTSYQPLTVPQPEYLRFVSDLGQRVQLLQDRADALARSISLLSDELRKGTSACLPAFTAEIKTTLSLLMSQYRQIKLRQLGLHEELQSSIDRYKQAHQLGLDFDRYLEEDQQSKSSSKTLLPRSFSLRSLHQLLATTG